MRVCIISDTHSYHRQITIPECDVLIHCGDLTFKGELDVIEDFSDWLKEQPAKEKVIIFGNHELGFQYGPKRNKAIQLIEDAGAHYLEDSSVMIEGFKIYGSPATPWFHNWEWNYQRGADIAAVWSKIPDDTNILITHGPPFMFQDEVPRGVGSFERVGCEDLLNRMEQLKELKLFCCGHLHCGYTPQPMVIRGAQFVNAASCNEQYNPINPPIIVELSNE